MDVYIDSNEPVLHVDPLMQGDSIGAIVFHGTYQGDFFISNLRVTHSDDVALKGKPAELPPLPDGVVEAVAVAGEAVAASAVEGLKTLPEELLGQQTWRVLKAGEVGAANLDRVLVRTKGSDTALVRIFIDAEAAKVVKLRYGFSDRMTMFLNGQAIADGNNTYGCRDFQFMGTVGFHAGVYLPLREGRNEFVVAVTETFGGWAFLGAIADRAGLSVIPGL